jgi:membrane protein required for colicin V production
MNGLDVVILLVFFASALIGAVRGFTKELFSLFSWGGSITLSYILLPIGRSFTSPYIANPMMADGAALFCIFIISLIFLSIIASVIAGYVHETSFRGVDHSLGFGFGMLRGVVVISAAELAFSIFTPRHIQSPTFQTARFIPMARKGGDTLLQILPTSLRNTILEQAIKVENQLNSKVPQQLQQGVAALAPGGPLGNYGDPKRMDVVPTQPGGSFSQSFDPNGQMGGQAGQQGYGGQPQPNANPAQQPQPGNLGYPQSGMQPPMVPQQGQYQGGAMVPFQGGQPQQYPSQNPPMQMPVPDAGVTGYPGAPIPQSQQSVVQSARPQDMQATVDQLSRLTPQAPQKGDSGYTQGQRDDMNRLFQAADGEE